MVDLTGEQLARVDRLLDHLGYDLDPSILIGGWATHARVGGDISRDIDLIIKSPELRQKLRTSVSDYSENGHHSGSVKGRGSVDGIHVDAYIPHESKLGGRLQLRVEVLAEHTEPERHRGWLLLTRDAHIATKIAALLDRPDTEKGQKDAREIVRLIDDGGTASGVVEVMIQATSRDAVEVRGFVATMFDLLPDRARLNKAERRRFADLRREWLDEVDFQLRDRSAPAANPQPNPVQAQPRRKDAGQGGNGGMFAEKRGSRPQAPLR